MVDTFIKLINEGDNGGPLKNSRGGTMFAKRALEMDDRDKRKRGRDDDNDDGRPSKRVPQAPRVLSNDEVRDAITPLWRMTYEEQLNSKAKEMVNKCSKKIVQEIKKKFR